MGPTDVILTVNQMNAEGPVSNEEVHQLVTDYIIGKNRSSLNKWQINSVVRKVLANRTMITHEDLQEVEKQILRKESGLPMSK